MTISISVGKCSYDTFEVTISSPVESGGGDHYCTIDLNSLYPEFAYLYSYKLDGVSVSGSVVVLFTSAGESYTLEVKLTIQDVTQLPNVSINLPYKVHGVYAPTWADIDGVINITPDFTPC
jgi:hypothetical protein